MANLSQQTASASIWVVGGRFVARILDFVNLLILARLLTPEDFGLVAIATSVLSIVEAVLEIPLSQALVRQPVLTQPMFATAFTLGLLRGAAITLIMVAVAWPLSGFYANPQLFPLIAVLSLAPALRGLGSPRMVVFMQRFDFRREFAADVAGKLSTLIVATGVALAFDNYWALAAGTIAGPAASTFASYVFAPMSPRLTLCEWKRFQDMIGWNSLSQVLAALSWQFDRLILPRFTSVAAFGAFSIADTLSGILYQTFVMPFWRPLNAAFARLPDDEARASAYRAATTAVMLVATPVFLCLGLLAEPFVRIVIGEEWRAAAPILQWLSLIGLLALPTTAFTPLVMALDRTRYATLRLVVELAIKVPAILLGVVFFGIEGVLAARAFAGLVAYGANLFIVRHLIGMGIGSQLASILRPVLCGAATAVLLLWVRPALIDLPSGLELVFALASTGLLALAVFWTLAFVTWRLAGRPPGIETLVLQQARSTGSRLVARMKDRAGNRTP